MDLTPFLLTGLAAGGRPVAIAAAAFGLSQIKNDAEESDLSPFLFAAGARTVRAVRRTARGVPALRQQYVDSVTGLAGRVPGMRQAGMSSEQIARALHAERRALGAKFKDLTPAEKLAEIHARSLERYGDKLGPSIEWLRNAGKSWDDIIESATRTGGKDLGF